LEVHYGEHFSELLLIKFEAESYVFENGFIQNHCVLWYLDVFCPLISSLYNFLYEIIVLLMVPHLAHHYHQFPSIFVQ
jgi:hypothetical protein